MRLQDKPLVSVVVPTYNSERSIGVCLKSVKAQSYSNIEIIVVDNYSTDKTREIAEKFGARFVLCKAGRSTARNIGAKKAIGELLFFVDSDMELGSNVVYECVKKIVSFAAIVIPEISIGEGFWAKCKALEKSFYVGNDLIEGIRFIRKGIFEQLNGFDQSLEAGEDWDLCNRIRESGYKITRIKASIKHEEGKLNLRAIVKKKYRYGRTIWRYVTKYPTLSMRQFNPIRRVFGWPNALVKPLPFLGLIVLKSCEYIAGFLGYCESRMKSEKKTVNQSMDYLIRCPEDRKIFFINHFLGSGFFRALDVGCGTGLYFSHLAKKSKEVVGLELSDKLCKIAKKRNIDVVRGDGAHMPFKNGVFDIVWASEVLEHMSSFLAFDELERVAKCSIVATMPNPYSPHFKKDPNHILRYSFSSLKEYYKTRPHWSYVFFGLGLELPAAPRGVKIPRIVKLFTFYMTLYLPKFAPTFCIAGTKSLQRRTNNFNGKKNNGHNSVPIEIKRKILD